MPRSGKDSEFHFEGFDSPNTTPVPDVVFDVLQARLTEAELKSLLYIIRRTFGFKKDRDPISFNQFLRGIRTRDGRQLDSGCGIRDRTTLSRALQSLEAMGVVVSDKAMDARGENATTVYSLKFKAPPRLTGQPSPDAENNSSRVVGNSYHRGMENPLPVVGHSYQQETVLQETEKQDTDPSNVRKVQTAKFTEGGSSTKRTAQARTQLVDHPKGPASAASVEPTSRAQRTRSADNIDSPADASGSPQTNASPAMGVERVSAPTGRSTRRTAHQKAYPEDRQAILSYIEDFARELGDEAPLPSSVTRAYNLWEQSGIPIEAFCSLLYEARTHTWKATANIKKSKRPVEGDSSAVYGPSKNRMAYFFGVLEELVQRHAPSGHNEASARGSAAEVGERGASQVTTEVPTPQKRRGRPRRTVPEAPKSTVAGVSSVGEVLGGREAKSGTNGNLARQRGLPDDRQIIEPYITRFAHEFGDEAPLSSSVSRAQHLYERSGVPMARFIAYLFEAQALTTEYSANVTKTKKGKARAFGPDKNRMAYFFGVLESRLALRPQEQR